MIVQFRNEKVSNHGSIPITIDCNVVAFIVFEEGFHQPIKRTKQQQFFGCSSSGQFAEATINALSTSPGASFVRRPTSGKQINTIRRQRPRKTSRRRHPVSLDRTDLCKRKLFG
ncbi:hypothetical protein TNCV_1598551 [Trichonephila clavipes]|nr:hypothetical protein TNCV_1598551 [Trichonephila clavipes]